MFRSSRTAYALSLIHIGIGLLTASVVTATEPDLGQCTWDLRVGRSPKNLEVGDPSFQYVLNGVLRDNQGVPIVNYPASDVALEILPVCANPVVLHPDANSNPEGRIRWGVAKLDQGGGACTGPAVAWIRIFAVGIAKVYNHLMSPDGNGDGLIALPDLGTFQHAFVTQTDHHYGDLNLDGAIDLRDVGFFQRHFTAP